MPVPRYYRDLISLDLVYARLFSASIVPSTKTPLCINPVRANPSSFASNHAQKKSLAKFESKNNAAPCVLSLVDRQQSCSCRCFEYIVNAITRQGAAFEVFSRANLLFHLLSSLWCRKSLTAFSHFFLRGWVVSEILLQPNQNDWNAGAPLLCLYCPFVLDVFQ